MLYCGYRFDIVYIQNACSFLPIMICMMRTLATPSRNLNNGNDQRQDNATAKWSQRTSGELINRSHLVDTHTLAVDLPHWPHLPFTSSLHDWTRKWTWDGPYCVTTWMTGGHINKSANTPPLLCYNEVAVRRHRGCWGRLLGHSVDFFFQWINKSLGLLNCNFREPDWTALKLLVWPIASRLKIINRSCNTANTDLRYWPLRLCKPSPGYSWRV